MSLALDILNRFLVRAQRRVQGVPRGAAHIYDRVASRYLEPSYEYVVSEAAARSPTIVVDVGCGPGKLLLSLAREGVGELLVGLDISRAMTSIARANAVRNSLYHYTSFVVADAHYMPVRRGGVDMILSTGTLHHIRDPEKVFRELTHSLRSDGEAWVYEFSHDAPWRDFKVTAKRLGRPALLIKFAAAMHGLPRKCFERGYIVRALRRAGVQYKLSYEAAMTKLILK